MTKTNPAHESGMHDRKASDTCPACETIRKAGACAECGEKVATQGDVDRHASRHRSGTDAILGIVAKPRKPRRQGPAIQGPRPAILPGDAAAIMAEPMQVAAKPQGKRVRITKGGDPGTLAPLPGQVEAFPVETPEPGPDGDEATRLVAEGAQDDPLPEPVEMVGTFLDPEPEPVVSIATGETVESGDPEHPIRYANREAWMLAAVENMRPWIAETGAECGPVRISFGWPGGRGSKVGVRGQCWMPTVIKDGVPAIFISPDQSNEDPVTLLGIILHEMNHAAGHWGHTGPFGKTAAALGFEKPWTSSEGKNDDLRQRLADLAEKLGPLDHGQINPEQWLPGTRRLILDPQTGEPVQGGPKVQTTRMRKVSCPEDGYTLRATTKWLDIAVPACPICGGLMDVEEKDAA